MIEDKKLDEKELEEAAGGFSGENMAEVGEAMQRGVFFQVYCRDCARLYKDCPYNSDVELIYRTWHGANRMTCHS